MKNSIAPITHSLAALALLGGAAVYGQDATESPQRMESAAERTDSSAIPLRPFLDGGPAAGTPIDVKQDRETSYRERLSVRDLDARTAAFDDIAAQAARDADARRALQSISEDTTDTELAFTARLALRESDRIGTWGRAGTAFGGQGLQTPTDPFDALRHQMDFVFGQDPFLNDFFANDPFRSKVFNGKHGVFGPDPFAGQNPVEEMQKRIQRMQANADALRKRAGTGQPLKPNTGSPLGQNFGGLTSSSSMSIQMTNEGIRVELIEDDGTGPTTKTYEAPSKEALLKAHPELKDRLR